MKSEQLPQVSLPRMFLYVRRNWPLDKRAEWCLKLSFVRYRSDSVLVELSSSTAVATMNSRSASRRRSQVPVQGVKLVSCRLSGSVMSPATIAKLQEGMKEVFMSQIATANSLAKSASQGAPIQKTRGWGPSLGQMQASDLNPFPPSAECLSWLKLRITAIRRLLAFF